jgi:pimeloyl-ACP methyl ester carboxylesterase
MMDLSSGASPGRRARIEREASTSLFGNAINFPGMYVQRAWNAVDLGDAFRRPVTSAVPALLLVGDLDPRTPVENAREIASTLRNGRVVVLENADTSSICSAPRPSARCWDDSSAASRRPWTVSRCCNRRSGSARPPSA